MYSVSESYKQAMKQPVQRFSLDGQVGTVPFTDKNILEGSFAITNQCSGNEQVQIGQVYVAELSVTFLKNLFFQRYSLRKKVIKPNYGIKLSGGSYETIPLGVFNIDKAEWTASGVVIKAYDNMVKFDKSFKAKNLSGTPYDLIKLACNNCNLELNMKESDFNRFANGTRVLNLYGENDIETWRDCVSWVAQTIACNVFADRRGKIILRSYNQTPVDTIDAGNRFTGSSFADYETRYTGISVVSMDDQATEYYALDEDDGLTYNLGSNPFMQNADSEIMCREILHAMEQIQYVPFSVSMIGNPAYDLMDVLSFDGGFADGDKLSCITKYSFTYNGKYSASGVGSDPALATANSKSDKSLAGLMEQVNSITNSINRLIYDYNTGPLVIGQDEQTLAMLTFHISEVADVEGHFLMHYRVSTSTHVVIRFYDQMTEELYSPMELDILAGEASIGIPHAYLNRQRGIHVVYVTAQVYSGTMEVDTRGVFFSIDAGNFAEAVDDVTMDVRDITLRQLMESSGPDQVWVVGIEKGQMIASRREYRDSYTSNPKWEGVYTAGEALDAAIEFDGSWVLRAGSNKFTIETRDQPWYFWIDPDNNLYAQEGDDETTRILLDTDVTKVNACRGYSSNIYPEQDQGLVVAYIKNKKPYYAQYIYDVGLGGKRWLQPERLINEEVEDFRVHRLNDYRLGFELTTTIRNLWMYTARTYVAQAVPKETGRVSLDKRTMFLYTHKDTDLSVTYTHWISSDGLTMKIFISKQIRYFTRWQDVIQIEEASIRSGMIDSVDIENTDTGCTITINLNQAARKLTTNVTINPNGNNDVQAFIPDWGYIQAPKATILFDTTIYRYATMPKEAVTVQNTGQSMAYHEITQIRTKVTEEITVQNTGQSMAYHEITQIRASENEEATVQLASVTMAYAMVAPTPI